MKNYVIKILIAACLVLTGASCKKFLDTKPQDSLTPVNYYQTPGQLNAALAGVYDVLGTGSVYGTDWWYRLGVSTDESFFRNPTNVDIRTLIASSSDPTIANTWNTLYKGINRANTLLDALPGAPVAEDVKARAGAEARFMRAYYYYLLVSTWGGVPLRLKGTTTVDDNIVPRSSIKEVYDQILLDMTAAEAVLPTITELGPNGSGHISKTAAPVITFSGGGGTGADATAVITRLEDADLSAMHTASPDAFRQAIQDERARELCFEGLRTADLKRWDIYISSLKATANDFTLNGGSFKYGANAGNNVTTRNLLLPIPVSELTINRAMTQNPGY